MTLQERIHNLGKIKSPKHTYRVASLSGQEVAIDTVECDTVEFEWGMIRFRLFDGTDVMTINSNVVVGYERVDDD